MTTLTAKLRNRYTAPILVALLLFQSAAWLITWHFARTEAHETAQNILPAPALNLRTVVLPLSLLPSLRVGKKEIRLEGRLYDIYAQALRGDSIQLQLYHDQHEEALFRALGLLLSPEKNAANAANPCWLDCLAKWLNPGFFPPASPLLDLPRLSPLALLFRYLLPAGQDRPACPGPPPKV